ncbi:hypothetical protein [uncultured Shewanella sp.]|uniref:hypothetical protein n=1 Tax=uncultured Shewanella sp. TaxID=173975 RepID=UPI002632301E|nr:hypothetical protein [uncultured Shewanella sp.]
MIMRPALFATVLSLSLSGCIINVNGADMSPLEHQHRSIQLDASELNALVAETGAGSLEIKGVDGLTHITIEADIYTRDGVDAELSLERQGTKAHLIADFDSNVSFGNSPYMDLVLKVPSQMKMDIDDGSGSIDISGVDADIKLHDGSGSIAILGGKNLDIEDGSGGITLKNVDGEIQLDDGSGSIEIEDVNGDITINDGSGSLSVKNVLGKVTIDDGSGSIDVVNTKGLNIIDSGSGDVSFDQIDGPVSMH